MAGMNVTFIHGMTATRSGRPYIYTKWDNNNELMVMVQRTGKGQRDRDMDTTGPGNVRIKFSARPEDIYFSNG